jgi:hypothetical protein
LVASVSVGPGQYATRAALSADDRYLLVNRTIWNVQSSTRVAELEASHGKAGFVSRDLLLVDQEGRLDFFRAPSFDRVASLVFSRDLSSAAVFTNEPKSSQVRALEILGDPQAFDSSFSCGVAGHGVPFRICRESLEQPGLFDALLE